MTYSVHSCLFSCVTFRVTEVLVLLTTTTFRVFVGRLTGESFPTANVNFLLSGFWFSVSTLYIVSCRLHFYSSNRQCWYFEIWSVVIQICRVNFDCNFDIIKDGCGNIDHPQHEFKGNRSSLLQDLILQGGWSSRAVTCSTALVACNVAYWNVDDIFLFCLQCHFWKFDLENLNSCTVLQKKFPHSSQLLTLVIIPS